MMECHACSCVVSPPCGACENCRHWDHPDCPNDCQTCENHFEAGPMSAHNCPRLRSCRDHPRWQVIKSIFKNAWFVYAPYDTASSARFLTHAEAITYAQAQAATEIIRDFLERNPA